MKPIGNRQDRHWMIMACWSIVLTAACKDSSFHSSGEPPTPQPARPVIQSPATTITQIPGGVAEDEGETIIISKPCDASSIAFAGPGKSCPPHAAAYTADDGSSAVFGCCPLPANDILTKDPAEQRSGQCAAGEVATGVVSGRNLLCSKINTQRYQLGAATKTCYNGDGSSGDGGSSNCTAPPATLQAMVAKFGSDACIGYPFGQLIVSNTGKDCSDITSAPLTLLDGSPVTMFK